MGYFRLATYIERLPPNAIGITVPARLRQTIMKLSHSPTLLSVLAPAVAAFPSYLLEHAANNPEIAARAEDILKRQESADAATALFEAVPIFDAEAQFIDVGPGSGHEYQAPGPDDLRGPCPGLSGSFSSRVCHA